MGSGAGRREQKPLPASGFRDFVDSVLGRIKFGRYRAVGLLTPKSPFEVNLIVGSAIEE